MLSVTMLKRRDRLMRTVTAALALGFLIVGIVWPLAHHADSVLVSTFAGDVLRSTTALASAIAAWLSADSNESVERIADLMLLGTAAAIRVSLDGEVIMDRHRAADAVLPTWAPEDGAPHARFSRNDDTSLLHVATPFRLPEGTVGVLQVASDASILALRIDHSHLLYGGIGLAVWLTGVTGLVFRAWGRAPGQIHHRSNDESADAIASDASLIEHGILRIDVNAKRAYLCEQPVALAPKPYSLLHLLAERPESVFSEEEIVRALWPDAKRADASDVRQCVYLLRRRLADVLPGADACIANQRGFGYRLDPESLAVAALCESPDEPNPAWEESR